MNRGEIYWAELKPRSGSEQQSRRPVLIISHDGFNHTENWRSIIVVPISSSPRQARRGPTAIPLPRGAAGLTLESTALCHQITTLNRAKLTQRIGVLSPPLLAQVAQGVRAALDL